MDSRFAVGIDDDLNAKLRETFRKMGYKQFCSTVIGRRYGDERRRNESDFQFFNSPSVYQCLRGEALSSRQFSDAISSPHFRGFDGIRHQHGDGERSYTARHRRDRTRHFRNLRVDVPDQH